MAQFARPVADEATGSWGNTPLWSKVDEGSPGGGDTISSADNSSPDNADLRLSDVTDPDSSANHVLRAEWNKSASGGHAINAVCELWQGVPGTGSLVATLSTTGIGATEQTDTYTLSAGEADSITDYAALYLRVSRQGDTGGNPNGRRSLVVDVVELEVPDAPVVVPSGAGSVTGGGTLSGLGLAVVAGLGLLTGGGALSGAGSATFGGTGAVAGGGALSGVGSAPSTVAGGAGTLAGGGALSGLGLAEFGGVGALAGGGALSGLGSAPSILSGGVGVVSGGGDLAGDGLVRFQGTGLVSGGGVLTGVSGESGEKKIKISRPAVAITMGFGGD